MAQKPARSKVFSARCIFARLLELRVSAPALYFGDFF
jgi:hypothetical protein